MSRRPDFYQINKLYRPNLNISWDGNVPSIIYNVNDLVLMALPSLESFNIDDDFLSQLKGAYSTCNFFSDENIERRKRHLIIEKS